MQRGRAGKKADEYRAIKANGEIDDKCRSNVQSERSELLVKSRRREQSGKERDAMQGM